MIAAFDLTDEDEDTAVTRADELEATRSTSLGGPVPSAAYLERIASRPAVPYIDWERARTIAVEPWDGPGDYAP